MKAVHKKWAIFVSVALVSLSVIVVIIWTVHNHMVSNPHGNSVSITDFDKGDVTQFESEAEFLSYISRNENRNQTNTTRFGSEILTWDEASNGIAKDIDATSVQESGSDRHSDTNIQVIGVDEADILKTDGNFIYYSGDPSYSWRGGYSDMTYIISAEDKKNIELTEDITQGGDLYIIDDILIIIKSDEVFGYDVTDKSNPERLWKIRLESNNYLLTSRFYDKKLYIIVNTRIDTGGCVFPVLKQNDNKQEDILCTDIYYPGVDLEADSTYTVYEVNYTNGDIQDEVSFLGNSSSSVVYISQEDIYITFQHYMSEFDKTAGFIEDYRDIFPDYLIKRVAALRDMDISLYSKQYELQLDYYKWSKNIGMDGYISSADYNKKKNEYIESLFREMESTGIVQLDIDNLNVRNTAVIPGHLLNQFSMDSYNGYLRVATTINEQYFMNYRTASDSVSDVYVLDKNLEMESSVVDLGKTERIYSVRFINDMAYVVTYKQVDPFYVIDMSNPKDIKMVGELKIPGYSAYLHPIGDDLILGIGEERGEVKVSLFDVSNPEDPQEVSKYIIENAYNSEIETDHHAFMQDSENEFFFVPTSNGGYFISYKDNTLKELKAVENIVAKRAMYIGNYLYMFGNEFEFYDCGYGYESLCRDYNEDNIVVKVFTIEDFEEVNKIYL